MSIVINTDIEWEDLVGDKTLEDSGYIGDLLTIAFAHVGREVDANRLTQESAGQIYTAMIPAAFQNALKFLLDEQLVEAQIESEINKLDADKNKAEAELEKHWGYDVTRDAEGNLILGISTDNGKIDEEVDLLQNQNLEVQAGTVRNDSKQADNELTSESNRLMIEEQTNLYVRQYLGFDDNKNQKVLDSALNYLGIISQDHEVPTLPSILTTDDGIDELFRRAMRTNEDPKTYNSTPVAANIEIEIASASITVGDVFEFNIVLDSIDYDNKLDYSSIEFRFPTTGVQTKVVAGEGTWTYDEVSRIIYYTCDTDLGADYPTELEYAISDIAGLQSYYSTAKFVEVPVV